MNQAQIEQARFNMIEQQVRTWDVLDQQVLDTMNAVPREAFVPERYASLAFADTNIPLGHEQVMMAPKVEAVHSILEVGTGSGYLTACLARLGRHVTSMDIMPDFIEAAGNRLAGQDIANVTLQAGDALQDTGDTRYDIIAVTGSLPVLQQQFHHNLEVGGRLFVISGELPIMEAGLITRVDEGHWSRECLFETCIPPLINATTAETFIF